MSRLKILFGSFMNCEGFVTLFWSQYYSAEYEVHLALPAAVEDRHAWQPGLEGVAALAELAGVPNLRVDPPGPPRPARPHLTSTQPNPQLGLIGSDYRLQFWSWSQQIMG